MTIEVNEMSDRSENPKPPRLKTPKTPPKPDNPSLDSVVDNLLQRPEGSAADQDAVTAEAVARANALREQEREQEQAPDDSGGFRNPFERPPGDPPPITPSARKDNNAAERVKQNKGTPSTKRMGALGAKLPGAEHAKIHKRGENGRLSLLGTVREHDMVKSQDIESFVHAYLSPQYGPGEYQITGVDAHGREFDMGVVDILAPIGPAVAVAGQQASSDQGALGTIVKMLMEQNSRKSDSDMRTLMENLRQQPDPIESMTKLHRLKQEMDPGPAPKDNSTTLALIAGLTQVATTVLGVMMQPKAPDPMMALLMAKMLDDKPRSSGLAELPPMLPAVDPTEQLKNLAAVVTSLRGPEKSGNDELIQYLLKDRMTPADVLNLVNQVKGERGTDDFKKSMENVGIMLNATNQMKAQMEPGSGAGFMDAVTALLGNRELTGAVAQTVRGARQPAQQEAPVVQNKTLAPPSDPLILQARANAEKRLQIEAEELRVREIKLAEARKAVVTPPTPPTPPAPAAQPREIEMSTAPEAAAPAMGSKPKLPDNLGEYINRFLEAENDEGYVEIAMEMVLSLGDSEEWKPYAEIILNSVVQSDRTKFLSYMASFFVAMRTVGLVEDELARKVMKALADNFEAVMGVVQELTEGGEEEGEEGEDDPLNVIRLGEDAPLTHPV